MVAAASVRREHFLVFTAWGLTKLLWVPSNLFKQRRPGRYRKVGFAQRGCNVCSPPNFGVSSGEVGSGGSALWFRCAVQRLRYEICDGSL